MSNADPIPRQRFSTLGLPRAEQFDAVRSYYAGAVEFLTDRPPSDRGFYFEEEQYAVGPLVAGVVRAEVARLRCFDGAVRRQIGHLCFFCAGRQQESDSAPTVRMFDTAMPTRVEIGHGHMFWLAVPTPLLQPHLFPGESLGDRLIGGRVGDILWTYLAALKVQLPALTQVEAPSIAAITINMLSPLIRALNRQIVVVRGRGDRRDRYADIQSRAHRYILDNLSDPELSVTGLCREIGVSRRTLHRVFAQEGGVRTYVLQRRLMEARQLLIQPMAPSIEDVADRVGFNDPANFQRAFCRFFGHRVGEVLDRMPYDHRNGAMANTSGFLRFLQDGQEVACKSPESERMV